MDLNDDESREFLGSLFPGGLKDADLIAELCPDGWGKSPLLASFRPAPEVLFEESAAMRRNLRSFGKSMKRKDADDAPAKPEEPEQTLSEFLAERPDTTREITAEESIAEPAELLGLCLWDVFSDNHEVTTADGRLVDLGSFRGSAGTIADFYKYGPAGPEKRPATQTAEEMMVLFEKMQKAAEGDLPWEEVQEFNYMRFYMGTHMIRGRTDLGPVYGLIFSRLKAAGADWSYSFPRLHVVDLSGLKKEEIADYDPSEAFQKQEEEKERAEELQKMRKQMDRDALAAQREARQGEPPETVRAYQAVYGAFPKGWPPDPYKTK